MRGRGRDRFLERLLLEPFLERSAALPGRRLSAFVGVNDEPTLATAPCPGCGHPKAGHGKGSSPWSQCGALVRRDHMGPVGHWDVDVWVVEDGSELRGCGCRSRFKE